jgi:Flp pilus assembly protein TadG
MAFWPAGKNPHGAKINMIRRFLRNESGQFAMMTAIATVPLLGGLALAIDYSEMSRQRQETMNALDAAGVATARQAISGASDADLIIYANEFFKANLSSVHPNDTSLTVVLPKNNTGGGTLKMSARFTYEPYFFSGFTKMVNGVGTTTEIDFSAKTEVRLKNTLEVALVLDNSGSMEYIGTGSGQKRIDLLKDAAKQLVDTISQQAAQMKQMPKPVQFSLVPFAASVNVGPDNADKTWMDLNGISPIHHENFDWSTMATANANKKVELSGGSYYKRGTGWGAEKDKIITRFTLYKDMQRQTGTKTITLTTCKTWNSKKTACLVYDTAQEAVYSSFSSWGGCVEARPSPYNVNDTTPASGTPATLFVPMFGPDETDQLDSNSRPANNNWWKDGSTNNSAAVRQRYMPKYYTPAADGTAAMGMDEGPNASCSTKAITPLVDVSAQTGVDKIKGAIDGMVAKGATNVPEGLMWGWRSVSGGEPFTEGRPDTEKGNDKVVIVLTDGANTYYTPTSVTAQKYSGTYWESGGNDLAGAKAIYSSYGYLVPYTNSYTYSRMFQSTSNSITKSDYSNANYSKAMDEHMATACTNAKTSKVIIMTVALDLDPTKGTAAEKAATTAQITGLTNCASMSRFRNGKLFWNTKGGDLAKTFKEIADELSNLRIVG